MVSPLSGYNYPQHHEELYLYPPSFYNHKYPKYHGAPHLYPRQSEQLFDSIRANKNTAFNHMYQFIQKATYGSNIQPAAMNELRETLSKILPVQGENFDQMEIAENGDSESSLPQLDCSKNLSAFLPSDSDDEGQAVPEQNKLKTVKANEMPAIKFNKLSKESIKVVEPKVCGQTSIHVPAKDEIYERIKILFDTHFKALKTEINENQTHTKLLSAKIDKLTGLIKLIKDNNVIHTKIIVCENKSNLKEISQNVEKNYKGITEQQNDSCSCMMRTLEDIEMMVGCPQVQDQAIRPDGDDPQVVTVLKIATVEPPAKDQKGGLNTPPPEADVKEVEIIHPLAHPEPLSLHYQPTSPGGAHQTPPCKYTPSADFLGHTDEEWANGDIFFDPTDLLAAIHNNQDSGLRQSAQHNGPLMWF